MTNPTNRRIEFRDADLNALYSWKAFLNVSDQVVGNVLEQTGRLFHHRCRDLIQRLVINGGTKPVTAGGFRKIGKDRDIYGVFIANLLLLVVKPVVGKKLKAF